MLTLNSIIAVRDIVSQMTYENKIVRVNSQSPLSIPAIASELNTDLLPEDIFMVGDVEADKLTPIERALQGRSTDVNADGVCVHSLEMDNLVKEMVRRISASVRYARGTLNPIIREILEKVHTGRSYYLGEHASENRVAMYDRPNILANPVFLEMIDTTAMSSSQEHIAGELNTLLGNVTAEDIYLAIQTRLGALDNQVREHLDIDKYAVAEMASDPGTFISEISQVSKNPYEEVKKILAFMFMDAVVNNRIDGVNTDDIPTMLRVKFANHRNFIAECIQRDIQYIDNVDSAINRSGGFIIRQLCGDYQIAVHAKAYRKWLSEVEGASIEVLIAYYNNHFKLGAPESMLRTSVAQLAELWKRNESTRLVHARSLADNDTNRELLRFSVYIAGLKDISDEEKKDMQIRLNTFLQEQPYFAAADLEAHVRKMVCWVLGDSTDGYRILTIMDDYIKNNEDANIDDASCEAVCEIYSEWFVNQCVITNF